MVTSYWDTESRPHSQPPLWLPPALSAPVGCDDDDNDDFFFLRFPFPCRERKDGREEKRKGRREGGKEGRKEL